MLALPVWLYLWSSLGTSPWKFSRIYNGLRLQAMIIIAWSDLGLIGMLTDADLFRNVSSIFITYAILNFLQGTDFLYV